VAAQSSFTDFLEHEIRVHPLKRSTASKRDISCISWQGMNGAEETPSCLGHEFQSPSWQMPFIGIWPEPLEFRACLRYIFLEDSF